MTGIIITILSIPFLPSPFIPCLPLWKRFKVWKFLNMRITGIKIIIMNLLYFLVRRTSVEVRLVSASTCVNSCHYFYSHFHMTLPLTLNVCLLIDNTLLPSIFRDEERQWSRLLIQQNLNSDPIFSQISTYEFNCPFDSAFCALIHSFLLLLNIFCVRLVVRGKNSRLYLARGKVDLGEPARICIMKGK